jgi:hypothetical protein
MYLNMQGVRKDTPTFDDGLHESFVFLAVNVVQSNEQLGRGDRTDAVDMVAYGTHIVYA